VSSASIEGRGGGNYAVSGDLGFESADALLAQSRDLFVESAPQLSIDLSGVSDADSAGLALMLEWLRWAAAHQRRLRFENVPARLLAIAGLSDLDKLLTSTFLPSGSQDD